jgi:hypothetical protein
MAAVHNYYGKRARISLRENRRKTNSTGNKQEEIHMFEGYRETTFMDALNTWDALNKKVRCIYRNHTHIFDIDTDWRADFKVHAGMILEGHWYIEI